MTTPYTRFAHSSIAVGPQQGRKVFTLQTLPPDEDDSGGSDRVAKEAGFSLHAGVSTEAHQRDKLERLCRYVTRPAVSEKRLAITSNGNIRYQLKTPYRDGTAHVIFERGGPSVAGFHREAGRPGSQATHKSYSFSWCVRSGRPPAK